MSLFKYFAPSRSNSTSVCRDASSTVAALPAGEVGFNSNELICIQEELVNAAGAGPSTRAQYTEKEKQQIGRYASLHGLTSAIRKFKKDFPKLAYSTVRPWMKRYEASTNPTNPSTANPNVKIGSKRGRPLYLSAELDQKLRAMIVNLRAAGAEINIHVVKGVLAGLIRSNTVKYGQFLEFPVTRSWVRSLYQRMKFSRRMTTTSRPMITRSVYEEIKEQFLHEISTKVREHNIPDELIFNADQTPSKYVATGKVTMAGTNSKHVAIKGGNDKRQITLTVIESLSGEMLPFQIIYKGKTKRSLPHNASKDTNNFLFSFNTSHWSNEKETLRLIDNVLLPRIQEIKERLNLPDDQKSLLIWDAFKGQNTDAVMARLAELNILTVLVPKNLTHLLQPLDITTNGSIKKFERKAFSEYLTKAIMDFLLDNPDGDVTKVDIDLKLSTLKPKHLVTIGKIYNFFTTEDGKKIILSGFRYTGITEAVTNARSRPIAPLDPFL